MGRTKPSIDPHQATLCSLIGIKRLWACSLSKVEWWVAHFNTPLHIFDQFFFGISFSCSLKTVASAVHTQKSGHIIHVDIENVQCLFIYTSVLIIKFKTLQEKKNNNEVKVYCHIDLGGDHWTRTCIIQPIRRFDWTLLYSPSSFLLTVFSLPLIPVDLQSLCYTLSPHCLPILREQTERLS